MKLHTDAHARPHIFNQFDQELQEVHRLAVEMSSLILRQWECMTEAMDEANLDSALEVVAQAAEVRAYETKIDHAILTLLAKENPVAGDLRMALSISKISAVMKYLGNEIAEMAKLSLTLYEPRNGTPTTQMLIDIVKICRDMQGVLGSLMGVLDGLESGPAHGLLQNEAGTCQGIQEAIKHQFAFVHRDSRQIRPVLTLLQILNSLEICCDHCKNLAEYSIFMIDGLDVRHFVLAD